MIKEGLYVAQKVNPEGHTDHSLPVLKITDPTGKLMGVFFELCLSLHNSSRQCKEFSRRLEW